MWFSDRKLETWCQIYFFDRTLVREQIQKVEWVKNSYSITGTTENSYPPSAFWGRMCAFLFILKNLTQSGPAFSVVRQALGLRGPDAENHS